MTEPYQCLPLEVFVMMVAMVSKSVCAFDPFRVDRTESNGAVRYLHKARFISVLYVDQSTETDPRTTLVADPLVRSTGRRLAYL